MDDGSQTEEWRDFYDSLWAARAHLAHQMIDQGESDPLRVIQSLEYFERRNSLQVSASEVRWAKREFDPKALLPSGLPAFREATFNGRMIEVSAYTYANLPGFLADFFVEQGPFDAVVELGCGFGQNLFKMYDSHMPRGIPYFGGDLSDSGVLLGRELARLVPDMKVEFFKFDHLAADLSPVAGVINPLVFTCHSLEQVSAVPQSFFAAVARLAPRVTCVHLEPFGFQVRPMNRTAQQQKAHFEKEGWNLNLHAAAENAEKTGIIQRTVLIPEIFLSMDNLNVTSLMVWTNQTKR